MSTFGVAFFELMQANGTQALLPVKRQLGECSAGFVAELIIRTHTPALGIGGARVGPATARAMLSVDCLQKGNGLCLIGHQLGRCLPVGCCVIRISN